MISEIEICNIALTRIGSTRTINSFDEKTKEADLCRSFYIHSRDSLLSMFMWSFATRLKSLAMINVKYSGWNYTYRYPSECLRVLRITGTSKYQLPSDSITYEVFSDENGRLILTDEPEAEISYVAIVDDSSKFDPLFTDALAWKLAAELALPLAAHVDLSSNASNQYEMALERAKSKTMNEQNEYFDYTPETIKARIS